MVSEESAERINLVLAAAQGPFRTRGRKRRYDESKWYAALRVMPTLDGEERRHVAAFLTRTLRKHEQDAAWMRSTAITGGAGALAGAVALEGIWRAVSFAILSSVGIYFQSKVAEIPEPTVSHAEGLLAALAETPRIADE